MSNPRFLVAKYVSDTLRMEPKNVGVILWTPDFVRARFRAEDPARHGQVDGRIIRFIVNDTNTYKRWVTYWRRELGKAQLVPPAGGPAVSRGDQKFVEALLTRTRSSYYLAEAGISLDPIPEDCADDLLDKWYARLVEEPQQAPASSVERPLVESAMDRLIADSGLGADPHLQRGYAVSAAINGGVHDTFEFSIAYANGTAQALYQTLELPKTEARRNQVTRANAFVFEHVIKADLVPKERCGALVYLSQEERADARIEHSLNVLRAATRVFDLADEPHGCAPLRDELTQLRSLPHG